MVTRTPLVVKISQVSSCICKVPRLQTFSFNVSSARIRGNDNCFRAAKMLTFLAQNKLKL